MPGGAPEGNQNARKSRLFEQAFVRAIKARDIKTGDGETLRKICDSIIDLALAKDIRAFAEMRDTVDGKPSQQVQVSGDPEAPLRIVHESK